MKKPSALCHFVLIWCILVFGAACVRIPKETATLSDQMGGMISDAKTAHYNLLDEYEKERRARIDEYMESTWIPRFIKTMAKDGDLWGKTCSIKNTTDAALELQGFVEAAARRIAAKRKELTDALDLAMIDLREAVRVHYAALEQSNQTVTGNLRSVRANDEVVESVLLKNRVDPAKMTPLKDVSKQLDKLFDKEK